VSGAPQSQLHSSSSPAPGSSCYYSDWGDPQGDAAQLDAAAYGALYDCPSGQWTFPVITYDTWQSSQLDTVEVGIDTDANLNTGCGGFEWMVAATYVTTTAQFVAATLSTPSCNQSTWTVSGTATVSRADNSSIALHVSSATINVGSALRWFAFIKGVGTPGDILPDNPPGLHLEEGFAGGACTDALFGSRAPRAYGTVADPPKALAVLRQSGFSDSRTAGAGVISASGDPLAMERALSSAGLPSHLLPDRHLSLDVAPNDPGYATQWNLQAVNAPHAWDLTQGSPSVVVADVDTGVDATHPDLAGKLVDGWNAVSGTALGTGNSDTVGHGTAVAGVIGASTNNGSGLASLGWKTSVMPIKSDDATGAPLSSAVVAGIRYAADHGARIVNLSLGTECPDPGLAGAVAYAQSKGLLVVASGGNALQEGNRISYPAAYPNVLAVGGTGFDGSHAGYANVGSYIDLVAPAGSNDGQAPHNIPVLASGGGITTTAGTSFAAPLVAAAAALVVSVKSDITAGDLAADLTSTATHLGTPGRNPTYGWGLLNAAAAVANVVPQTPPPSPTPSPTPPTPPSPTPTPSPAPTSAGPLPEQVAPPPPPKSGYWMVGSGGDVYAFGDAPYLGGVPGAAANIEPTASGKGYWIVSPMGRVAAFGDATLFGDARAALGGGEKAVSISRTSTGAGYWIFTDRGRVSAFGDAKFLGDMSAVKLNGPVLGSISTPSGRGYYMVASDGGIFTFGDAAFHGSMGGRHLNAPVKGLVPTTDGSGYWLVASDGGIFAFEAPFRGSMGSSRLNRPVTGMVRFGNGYLMVAEDGGVFNFSDRQFAGSLGSNPPALPVAAVATLS
jgi:subtilisin family serine protease